MGRGRAREREELDKKKDDRRQEERGSELMGFLLVRNLKLVDSKTDSGLKSSPSLYLIKQTLDKLHQR